MGTNKDRPFFTRNRHWDDNEIKIYAAVLYGEGMPPREICNTIKEEYGVSLTLKAPARYFQDHGRKGMVHVIAPCDFPLQRRLGRRLYWLDSLEVIRTLSNRLISQSGARTCLKIMARQAARDGGGDEFHIGIGGGLQTKAFICHLVKLLDSFPGDLPRRIVFHGMVSGVHLHDPSLDPAFLYMYLKEKFNPQAVELDFVQLSGPILLDTREIKPATLKKLPGIQEAMAEAAKLDLIVTSAASWHDECSAFRRNMSFSDDACRSLETSGVRGDFCFQPFSDEGAIEDHDGLRFHTLMELSQFPEFIQKGGKVLFLLGPCNDCQELKQGVLEVLLGGTHRWFTDLVIDGQSAALANELLNGRDTNS